jgi:hypothetical protein
MKHHLRILNDALVIYLKRSTLKNRFAVGFNPEISRWVISLDKLSETEFNDIFTLSSRLGLDSTQWDISGNADEPLRTIRIAGLTNTQARDLVRAVALRFKSRAISRLSNPTFSE